MNELNHDLNLLVKKTRSRYLKESGVLKAVCCTCGNTARYLRDEGVVVVEIGNAGQFTPNWWQSFSDMRKAFPKHFDATSGHLPMHMMHEISELIRLEYKNTFEYDFKDFVVDLPTGSGETLVILKLAFPLYDFNAHYNLGKETEYSEHAPLNNLVKLLANKIYF